MNALLKENATNAIVWVLLLTMPWWMNAVGGYTELANRVVVLGLTAIALNFLLGFTGVLNSTATIARNIRDLLGGHSEIGSVPIDEDAACIAMDVRVPPISPTLSARD